MDLRNRTSSTKQVFLNIQQSTRNATPASDENNILVIMYRGILTVRAFNEECRVYLRVGERRHSFRRRFVHPSNGRIQKKKTSL